MQLTRKERWSLANQYHILELLERNEAQREGWARIREALEHGYETDYEQFCQHIYDGDAVMTEAESGEVHDILSMCDAMRHHIAQHGLPEGVEEWQTKFHGFDCNKTGEQKYATYARYYCAEGRYEELPKGDRFNSHMPTLAAYRRQLKVWETCSSKQNLTVADVKRIAAAAPHPGNQ